MTVLSLQKPRRAGRPKMIREEKDSGTPELQFKRAHDETEEALDLCLTKGLITQEQHWCGIHLRWLYTLRYGAPGVRAVDPAHVAGLELESDDPKWRELREAEYHEAAGKLHKKGHLASLNDICIHNERPLCLKAGRKNPQKTLDSLEKLRDGLDILVAHWQRGKKK